MASTSPRLRTKSDKKVFIFDTHPIQYRSPVFRALQEIMPETKVFFFDPQFDGKKWWFHEVGKIPKQEWALDLTSGFSSSLLNSKELGVRKFYRTLSDLFQRERPDAVFIYGYYLPEHWILWWLCKNLDIPLLFIGETFSRGGTSARRAIKNLLQPIFFKGVKQFVSIGSRSRDFYLSFGTSEAKITPARYCIDTSFFEMTEKRSTQIRSKIRSELKIPKDAFVILFVGRLFERKRPWDMGAIHKHFTSDSRVHTLVVGNGPLESDIDKTAKELPRFHPLGFKNQAQTRDLYHAADLLIVPSEYETWGLVINEAFSAGLPALVTPECGAAGDLVIAGDTGFVFPIGDITAATDHIRWCMENKKKFLEMGRRAKAKVTSEFRVDQFADAMVNAVKAATNA